MPVFQLPILSTIFKILKFLRHLEHFKNFKHFKTFKMPAFLAADPLYSLGVGVAHTHVQPVTRQNYHYHFQVKSLLQMLSGRIFIANVTRQNYHCKMLSLQTSPGRIIIIIIITNVPRQNYLCKCYLKQRIIIANVTRCRIIIVNVILIMDFLENFPIVQNFHF